MNYNYRDGMYMNANLQNVDASCGSCLLNSHNLSQYKKSRNLNDVNMGVENGDVNGGNCYMNSPTGSKETRLCRKTTSNLVRIGQNIRAEISLMEKPPRNK